MAQLHETGIGRRQTFDRDATDQEAQAFKEYLDLDVGTWLEENAKTFMQKLVDEGKFDGA